MPRINPGTKPALAQKVLVRAINEFLRRGYFGLTVNQNDWGNNPILNFEMNGIPTIASVADSGHGELSIRIALWPTEMGMNHIMAAALHASTRRKMGGFYSSGWLERKKGAWLQTSNGLTVACARDREASVTALPWEEPLGFAAEGKFFL